MCIRDRNKNFLESEGIITFTDASGRVRALKPDVTMSIVKHTKPDAVSSKLYYCLLYTSRCV